MFPGSSELTIWKKDTGCTTLEGQRSPFTVARRSLGRFVKARGRHISCSQSWDRDWPFPGSSLQLQKRLHPHSELNVRDEAEGMWRAPSSVAIELPWGGTSKGLEWSKYNLFELRGPRALVSAGVLNGAIAVLTASVLTGIIGRVVILNDFTITHMPRSGTELPPPVSGSAAGYIIFTSGSTAIRLIQRGAGPEVFVPIHTERSKWTLVALLAVVKAGAAFTLFDPSHPQEQTTLPVSRNMVPMEYVPLPDFPTNKSMKTDRPQLRDLAIRWSQEEMAGRPSEEKTPPRTAREQTIQKLVSQTLHLPVDQVGLIDNLIMLGGDSFHAVKLLVSSATQPCGLLGINDAGAFIRDAIAPQIEFTADSILDVLPTTEFQAECILDWPLSYFLVTMHGPLDKTRLRAACQLLVERHEIYRMVYVRHGPATLQVFRHNPLPFSEIQYDEGQDLDMDSPPPIRLQHLSLGAEPDDHTAGTLIGLTD
ncbi:hypothetical protein CNMCM6936_001929 [Aspergillus lentulus]|nr:hypothetical protein CNMCM6069_002369 [Aspergillus lentulus]KAF4168615.1 hypothetical protein CNMCM6936_001929 [Aspergillus lentulus]